MSSSSSIDRVDDRTVEPRARLTLNFTESEAGSLAERGSPLPLVGEVAGDLLTPVGAFLRVAADRPHAFLLESVEGGERIGRWSFLGSDPRRLLGSRGSDREREPRGAAGSGDPLGECRDLAAGFHPVPLPDLPPFAGGFVGTLAYDAVRTMERLPRIASDELGSPDLEAAIYDTVLAFDHLRQRIQIVVNLFPGTEGRSLADEYADAKRRIEEIVHRLSAPLPDSTVRRPVETGGADRASSLQAEANLGEEEFVGRVLAAKAEIARGEVFQVVLSRRLRRPFAGDPFAVYRALRAINPSPYNFFIRSAGRSLAGASPEMLVRVRDGRVETRPIAGTRPRGCDDEEDARFGEELLGDPKERAEHLMLVDLGRNDLGRIAAPGSVRVRSFAAVERYSHVMHLVSSVEARLSEGLDSFDALLACFPAGTVSGAPKIRAMEIIEGLEPTRRGPYAGAVFYRGFDGALDSAIAIRTILIQEGQAYVQAGAGIVADSIPEAEFRETEGKARAALAALDHAERAS